MHKDVAAKYKPLFDQITTPLVRDGLVAFLGQEGMSMERVATQVRDYAARLEDGYRPLAQDTWLNLLWSYERKGNIHSPISEEEIVALARESKKETYLS